MPCAAVAISFVPRPMLSCTGWGMGLGRLPERRERFPLPGGFQRVRWGKRGRGRVCVWGFKVCGVCGVCGVCIPETQRKRGQRDG